MTEPAEPTPEQTPDEEPPITEEQVREAEEEGGEPEPEPEDASVIEEAQRAATEREIEAKHKRIDRAVQKMITVLETELADTWEHVQACPRCAGDFPGIIFSPQVKAVLPETRAAVMISMGEDPDPVLNQDPRANRCQVCDGFGQVATGSKVRRQEKLDCEECKGRGWVGPRSATIPAQGPQPAPVLIEHSETNGTEPPPTDPWGRVRGEPLYGVMPGFEH